LLEATSDVADKSYHEKRAASISAGALRPDAPQLGVSGDRYGADPEVFVVDSKTGIVIPAWEFLPSKDESGGLNTKNSNEHWDGFQAEAQIKPSHCHQYLVDYMHQGLVRILQAARKVYPTAKLVPDCVVRVPLDMMWASNPEHVALGCAPSLNAYQDEEQLFIDDPKQLAVRFAGSHLHYGGMLYYYNFDLNHIVKTLDRIFGVLSVNILQGLEDPVRRQFYGKAGEYRLPPHGLEYRTPSSAMLCHPAITHLCLDLARAAMRLGAFHKDASWECPEEEAREIINSCDVVGAKKVITRNWELVKDLVSALYGSLELRKTTNQDALALIECGAKELLETQDMEGTWRLSDGSWTRHSDAINCRMGTLSGLRKGKIENVEYRSRNIQTADAA
jgi:hypothetical protein